MIEVLEAGPLTTVQDLGRPGLAHLGVGRSGAADRGSHRLANRLVGNPASAATLEATLGGLVVRLELPGAIAVTGASCPVRVDGVVRNGAGAWWVDAGQVVQLGSAPVGLRAYLAIRGGIDVRPVLGSRSTDLLAGLGPPPVRAGDRLPVGSVAVELPVVDAVPVAAMPAEPTVRVVLGPRDDWFTDAAIAALGAGQFVVQPDSDRVGVRLAGPVLERRRSGELLSEGMVEGAVQVPPDGHPVVLLADHPVTGGYPVVAVVHPADVDLVAQLRPGQRLRFAIERPGGIRG